MGVLSGEALPTFCAVRCYRAECWVSLGQLGELKGPCAIVVAQVVCDVLFHAKTFPQFDANEVKVLVADETACNKDTDVAARWA